MIIKKDCIDKIPSQTGIYIFLQKNKPKYNIIWKDNKTHLYIKITVKEEFPKIYSVRQENDNKQFISDLLIQSEGCWNYCV